MSSLASREPKSNIILPVSCDDTCPVKLQVLSLRRSRGTNGQLQPRSIARVKRCVPHAFEECAKPEYDIYVVETTKYSIARFDSHRKAAVVVSKVSCRSPYVSFLHFVISLSLTVNIELSTLGGIQLDNLGLDGCNGNLIAGNTIATYGNECVEVKEGSSDNIIEYNVCSNQRDENSGCFCSRGDSNIIRCVRSTKPLELVTELWTSL